MASQDADSQATPDSIHHREGRPPLSLGKVGEGLLGAASIACALASPAMRRWRRRWGASPDEVQGSLAGDALVPSPRWSYTHGITIHGTPQQIWPWIVQIGQGRGGFYSYEFLENLAGCKMRNAEVIFERFQQLAVADEIRIHPKQPPFVVAQVTPPQALVLRGRIGLPPQSDEREPFVHVSWAFVLRPSDHHNTRLITRGRYDYSPSLLNRLSYGTTLIEPVSFVMERKMLQGIKKRVEHAAFSLD